MVFILKEKRRIIENNNNIIPHSWIGLDWNGKYCRIRVKFHQEGNNPNF